MTRIRFFAFAVTFGAVTFGVGALSASTAFAGTITTPTAPFLVPQNAAGMPVAFKIVGSGYSPGTNAQTMICDGLSPSLPLWNIGIDCDNGTAPPAAAVQPNGTATWDPAVSSINQSIGVFDGEGPSSNFNCFYPGELDHGVAYSDGQIDPNNGLASWTNCQVRVGSTNGSATTDQAFVTFTLQQPGGGVTTTTTTVGTTTTTTTAATTTTSTVAGTTTTSSTTTSSTVPGTTTTSSTTTTSTVARSTSTSSTTLGAGLATTGGNGLALTGLNADGLAVIALCLLAIGFIAKSRGRA